MVNLLVLLLLTYHLRGVVESLSENNFVLVHEVQELIASGFFLDIRNYLTLIASAALPCFSLTAYVIEWMAAKGLPGMVVYPLIIGYLTWMLIYPVLMIQWIESSALSGTYFMIFTVGLHLKLISFHHVMHDNRYLLKRVEKVKNQNYNAGEKDKNDEESLANLFGIQQETFHIAMKYPKNLRVLHYLRFLVAPTCCYQHVYPTNAYIDVKKVVKHFCELVFCNLFMGYLIYQHMVPIANKGVVHLRNQEYAKVLLDTLHMAVPGAYAWLAMFYSTFHAYLNFFAELTQFADRRFYSDWWNANNLGEYWRKWNHPIHNWLQRHVYFPLRRSGFSSSLCLLITFTVSAVAHEYVVIGIFSVVNFVAFTLMMVNVPCMIIQRQLKGIISGNTNNFMFWLFYIILGQPFGIIICFY